MSTVTRTRWVGWAKFAGVILLLSGLFHLVQAIIALVGPNTYWAVGGDSLWLLDLTGWGWWNLIVGVLLVITAGSLVAGQTWARVVAVILAAVSALSQLVILPAQPWWSLIVIALDVLIIYALIVHGKELRIPE